jgi:hypothetical protein
MSDGVDEHLDKAFASLDDVPVCELHATSEALERRKDRLGDFAGIFRNVADARQGGWDSNLPRFHVEQAVRRADSVDARRERVGLSGGPKGLGEGLGAFGAAQHRRPVQSCLGSGNRLTKASVRAAEQRPCLLHPSPGNP